MNRLQAAGPGAGTAEASAVEDARWYKDAIVYQLHVKAFSDSDDDGMGDFAGLMEKLDYIEALGATAVWLLPFYPSPLRDDGYDIADYRQVNATYGGLRDFRRFVREAHRRGLRVITELVINHTSDQHPWFQRARRARPGSAARAFYVWSDNDRAYAGTRIIFLDTEKSNWTWDPEAQAYFWHRFYSHQPDLNFDNPRVVEEVTRILRYWLDMGVDGLRLDAVPYLIEREGTNNENLPETHAILRRLRREVDEHYPDRMLLAEANQWPEDACLYFGRGDECHMAFHFPLMPRIFMALAQEDRHPITDIVRQTPEIPENCQWAIFLRNHDELTLEMVTDRERDYLWRTYATDSRARINLGIRRRLAPLLENDRRKIELLNGLLMSMPGAPVIYYGDELGMGDNIYLGDRDGVRTPMQWSADRNGGFSRASPQKLYLPPIMDAIYGYEAVNVEAQQQSPTSLLNWMRRLIAVRKSRHAFARGSQTLLYPRNRKILAFLREYEDEVILCVANLSRAANAVELDLRDYNGYVPVELMSRSPFPPIGELPYLLTLAPYGFYWFSLAREAEIPDWHVEAPPQLPEFVTVIMAQGWGSVVEGDGRRLLEREALPPYLNNQRWFSRDAGALTGATLRSDGVLSGGEEGFLLTAVEVAQGDTPPQRYFLPLAVTWGEEAVTAGSPLLAHTLARARRAARLGALHEAVASDGFARRVVAAMGAGEEIAADGAAVRFHASERLRALGDLSGAESRPLGGEQSNTTVLLGNRVVLKTYRRLREGVQPELEVARFLSEVGGFANTPALLGWAERRSGEGAPTVLAAAFEHVENQGDAWRFTLNELDRILDETAFLEDGEEHRDELLDAYAGRAALLGRRTGEMHRAFAAPTDDPDFAAEPVDAEDVAAWAAQAGAQVARGLEALESRLAALTEAGREDARALLSRREALFERLAALARTPPAGLKTRLHGDYHLGQVLVAKGDFSIIDFEGEPRKTMAERRAKASPLRDVAGMLRSFDYAAWTAFDRSWTDGERSEVARQVLDDWRRRTREAFLAGYFDMAGDDVPSPTREALLDLFQLEKAHYEIEYEAAHRAKWLPVPVRGALDLLGEAEESGHDG